MVQLRSSQSMSLIERNHLAFQLTSISVRELLFVTDLPCDVYGIKDGVFELVLKRRSYINKEVIKGLIQAGRFELFINHGERQKLITYHQDNLRKLTRSLSVGDPLEKGKKVLNLLTINMEYLYKDPTNDETLNLQYQSAKNLSAFLAANVDLHEPLYKSSIQMKHHFIFAQPLLSSLFLLGVLKMSHLFNAKDIESLFITSYFKDIGMSAIPTEKYDQMEISDEEKKLLSRHAMHSVNILQGRIQLGPQYLTIIENHHSFSLLAKDLDYFSPAGSKGEVVAGFETALVCVMDVIAAMISGRPFRPASNLFDSLELVKALIAEQYPQEFKLIVTYFKNFFFKK
ncbi:MAG: hypothetical protein CME71_06550 [Halobacteriovorax sp.]|nr:hypothetical protein [Halobacteriovorax sp.]